ncbi:flagellar biosynthesis protein FlhF [Neobacillus niacini]|uniref:flagellar biosynthesis protein FlhF n=1 Tax=Neobacillus niacini TaxID=86668 RepID=UPI003B02D878
MIIKTYVVNKVTEAYPMIFHDLGTEAFILKTKPIKTGGFFGLFRKKQVEVVAAADHYPEKSTHAESNMKAEKPVNVTQKEVLKELSEVKGLIKTIVKDEQKTLPTTVEKWVQRLREQEVDEEVIEYIVKKVKMNQIQNLTPQEIEQSFLTIIEQLFEEGKAKESDSKPFLITLVGPTGVGKTTTIAKLAAACVFHQRQKVGLLTTDTYRIAAVEQLKTYAGILNIPLEVVSNPADLSNSMEALKGCHMIFMDSAGRNYLEEEYVEEINQYLRCDTPQENYLVLSMTTRWRDMQNIVEQMKSVPIDKLILTKWDETSCYGVALNMVYHYPYPLSYVSLGQGVPQDIMKTDPVFMAKKILGVDEHETGSSTPIKTFI